MIEGMKGVSTYAQDVDQAFIVVTLITLLLFIITIGAMFYFIYKYRETKHKKEDTKNIKHYTPLEIAWTIIPTILMGIVFYYGLESLRVQRTMPKDDMAINVKVTAQRWFWSYQYENGKKSNTLTIPVNTDIKLRMTAPVNDVLHSFFVPAFRAKEDVIPGQITKLWFNANKIGKYDVLCAEYCGTRHSYMASFVNVISKEDYKAWVSPKEEEKNSEDNGKSAIDIMQELGCTGCHSFDGSVIVGPSLNDIYNKDVKITINGKTKVIKRDELYLQNAILKPNLEIADGFSANLMPAFKDVISEKDLEIVLNYFIGKKVKKTKKAISAEDLLNNNGCVGCHSIDGSKIVGPSFKNMFKRVTKVKKDGSVLEIIADEKYIKNSIINPADEIVDGYINMMPAFKGVLSEEELDAVINYIKTLKE